MFPPRFPGTARRSDNRTPDDCHRHSSASSFFLEDIPKRSHEWGFLLRMRLSQVSSNTPDDTSGVSISTASTSNQGGQALRNVDSVQLLVAATFPSFLRLPTQLLYWYVLCVFPGLGVLFLFVMYAVLVFSSHHRRFQYSTRVLIAIYIFRDLPRY
jgi:hypothetical protein